MDGSTFDRLTRAVSSVSSRRRLLGLLTSLGLSGLLTHLDDESTEAKRKRHGRRRGHRPGKRKDKRKGKRKRGKGGGGLGGPGPCTADGGSCQQNSDCCSDNCFGQVCADPVTECDGAACPAGASGCCAGTCCQEPTNQCNALGECCAPNCNGKQCGPDGCGNTGTCGTCSGDLTCDESSGKCLCTAENCPDGCCSNGPGNPGTCESGETFQQGGAGGAHCAHCANTQTCQGQQCVGCTQGNCTCSGQSACLTPEAPNVICSVNEFCYCAVTTAGVPVCASGAIAVRGGCETDQDCVDAFAGAYCLNAANNVNPQNPCFFGQSFCGGACNP
jgi:hypothetical protein